MIRHTVYMLLSLLCISSYGQDAVKTSQNISADEYRQDFAFLRQSFEKTYPSLYRFKEKAAVERLFDSCNAAVAFRVFRTVEN